MQWLEAFMWWLYSAIANTLTVVGLAGLLCFGGVAIKRFCEKLIYEEDVPHEDQY